MAKRNSRVIIKKRLMEREGNFPSSRGVRALRKILDYSSNGGKPSNCMELKRLLGKAGYSVETKKNHGIIYGEPWFPL